MPRSDKSLRTPGLAIHFKTLLSQKYRRTSHPSHPLDRPPALSYSCHNCRIDLSQNIGIYGGTAWTSYNILSDFSSRSRQSISWSRRIRNGIVNIDSTFPCFTLRANIWWNTAPIWIDLSMSWTIGIRTNRDISRTVSKVWKIFLHENPSCRGEHPPFSLYNFRVRRFRNYFEREREKFHHNFYSKISTPALSRGLHEKFLTYF